MSFQLIYFTLESVPGTNQYLVTILKFLAQLKETTLAFDRVSNSSITGIHQLLVRCTNHWPTPP